MSIVNTGFEVIGKLFCIHIAKRNSRYALTIIAVGFSAASIGGILGTCMWAGVLSWFGVDAAGNTLLMALVAFVFAASFALGKDYDSQGDMGGLMRTLTAARMGLRGDSRVEVGQRDGAHNAGLALEASAHANAGEAESDRVSSEESSEPSAVSASGAEAETASGFDPESESVYEDRLNARCVAVAEQYGLSSRELDVLILLSQGRSRALIREALHISKGTVDSHIHHIYSKMGISSKDELMRQLLD